MEEWHLLKLTFHLQMKEVGKILSVVTLCAVAWGGGRGLGGLLKKLDEMYGTPMNNRP